MRHHKRSAKVATVLACALCLFVHVCACFRVCMNMYVCTYCVDACLFSLIINMCVQYLSNLEIFALLRDKYDIIENVLIYYFLAKSLTVI